MKPLSFEERRRAAAEAPRGRELHRPDTRVIERPGWYQIITPSAPYGVLNEVLVSELAEDEVERVIDETIADYRAVGQPTKWCVGSWTKPADFGERLARRGFTSWEVRGMGAPTDLAHATPASPHLTIEQAEEANLDEYLTATIAGWSMKTDSLEVERDAHRAELRRSPRSAWFFSARAGGKVVGTAGLFGRAGYGYLVGAVVLPEARGRGVYRDLITARLAFLRERGLSYAVTQAREATSAPILERMGFETLFRSTCWRLEAEQR